MKHLVLAAALLTLGACANHQPTKNGMMGLPGFMNETQTIERQRPTLPVTHYIRWGQQDRLMHGLELDYISGMSQRDYLFEEPNQGLFRPMVASALADSGLEAKTAAGARYALQIEFQDLDSDAFGRHFAGKTSATYRVVDRRTGAAIYENVIRSNFIAEYPGLNEEDASFAYNVSAPGVIASTAAFGAFGLYEGGLLEVWNNNVKLRNFFGGDTVDELSQAEWNDAYQGYVWTAGVSALSGPALVALGQMNPLNYVSLQVDPANYLPLPWSGNDEKQMSTRAARQGNLSTVGQGSRNARTRARQLNTHILAQSLTYFLLDLAESEDVRLTQLVACKDADYSAAELVRAVRMKTKLITDDCLQYTRKDTTRGVPITAYK
ncbi:hypothetical protein K1X12_03095 [Hyphomonas sp. WL0036]|uniref:hypothetical protein n=1 Tax=Hyphomonas sediminis TaxID=2866160 RepID=UPI001C8077BB|nr:hypothetical protein [Hyphomonas sediminis]MBY9065865.1 hypothetical protein [Hyphomonas sediminis]